MISMADFALFVLFIISIIYVYCQHCFKYWKTRGVEYVKPKLIFGNLLDIVLGNNSAGKYIAKLYDEFTGPYFGFFAFTKPFLIIKDPDIIKRVLIKDFHVFPNRFFFSDENIDPILSNSLVGIKTPHWKSLRTKLSPVFTSGKMKAMFQLINECGKNLEKHACGIVNKKIEMKELAVKYTTDVISTCAFGINANSFTNENNEFITHLKSFDSFLNSLKRMSYFFMPGLVKLCKYPFINATVTKYFNNVFKETINQREQNRINRNDLINILIDLKNQESTGDDFRFYGDRLVAQAFTFFFAGQETTSSTIAFTLHELYINNNIQERLRNEINEVILKHGMLNYEAVQDMVYLDMIVSETLRKYPLTPFIHRECSENYNIPETGLMIEKGTPIIIPQHGLHWDPKYFPNPEIYDPERFNKQNKPNIPNYVYLPFGDGPRNCIGERFGLMSTKLGLIHIIRNLKVEKNEETQEPLEFGPSPLLRSKNGVQLTLKKLASLGT